MAYSSSANLTPRNQRGSEGRNPRSIWRPIKRKTDVSPHNGWALDEQNERIAPDNQSHPCPSTIILYPTPLASLGEQRTRLAPEQAKAFRAFGQAVFAEGALSATTKQLIAVAVAHVTQCPYCIRSHTRKAVQHGATPEQIVEAIWVAAEMRAGGSYAHAVLALDTIAEIHAEKSAEDAQ
jgi:AhpD family alkylhydroperoxidase